MKGDNFSNRNKKVLRTDPWQTCNAYETVELLVSLAAHPKQIVTVVLEHAFESVVFLLKASGGCIAFK